MSNNPPYAVVELTREQYDFLVDNCAVNMSQGLAMVDPCGPLREQPLPMSTVRKIVDMVEKFRGVKAAVEKGKL